MGNQQLSSVVGEWVMRNFRADKESSFCICDVEDALDMSIVKSVKHRFVFICAFHS